MAVSYKRLWKLLIDKDMKKRDLKEAANLSPSLMSRVCSIMLRDCAISTKS